MPVWRKLAVVLVVAGMAGAFAAVPALADTAMPTSFGFGQVDQGLPNTGKTVTVRNPRQTRIENFRVPATHEIHANFEPSGTVQELNGKKWQAAPSATVALYGRSLPKGKWAFVGSVKANSSGAFAWKYQIHRLGRFAWQARVEQTTVGSTEYKASDSAAKNSLFADKTYVTAFVVLHLYGDTSIGALMEDYPESGGGAHYANVTGIAKFYYEPTGSKSWRYLGESRATNANPGSVSVEPVGTLDGNFKIVFPAQGDFLGSSATHSLT
jgi:hypothetical protein